MYNPIYPFFWQCMCSLKVKHYNSKVWMTPTAFSQYFAMEPLCKKRHYSFALLQTLGLRTEEGMSSRQKKRRKKLPGFDKLHAGTHWRNMGCIVGGLQIYTEKKLHVTSLLFMWREGKEMDKIAFLWQEMSACLFVYGEEFSDPNFFNLKLICFVLCLFICLFFVC